MHTLAKILHGIKKEKFDLIYQNENLALKEIKETVLKWPQFGEEVGVSAKLIDHINRCLLNRLKN